MNWLCEQEGELDVTITDIWGPGVNTAPGGKPWSRQGIAFRCVLCSEKV